MPQRIHSSTTYTNFSTTVIVWLRSVFAILLPLLPADLEPQRFGLLWVRPAVRVRRMTRRNPVRLIEEVLDARVEADLDHVLHLRCRVRVGRADRGCRDVHLAPPVHREEPRALR